MHVEPAIEFYFSGNTRLPCGWRVVIPHSRREHSIELLDIAKLVSDRIPLTDFDNQKRVRRLDVSNVHLGLNLARRIVDYSSYKVKHAPAAARAILSELVPTQ